MVQARQAPDASALGADRNALLMLDGAHQRTEPDGEEDADVD